MLFVSGLLACISILQIVNETNITKISFAFIVVVFLSCFVKVCFFCEKKKRMENYFCRLCNA